MEKMIAFLILWILLFQLAACTTNEKEQFKDIQGDRGIAVLEESKFQNAEKTVELLKITDSIWVHITYKMYEGYNTPSNGVVVRTSEGLVLVDTPWDNEQTKDLIALTREVFDQEFVMAVITHAHDDRIGGIDTLLENHIKTISTQLTREEAKIRGYKLPEAEVSIEQDTDFTFGDMKIRVSYPGPGHTVDNTVVWFPQDKVLFGGCLVKALDSTSIGNAADANMLEWPRTLERLIKSYEDVEVVIPGHGGWGTLQLVQHTRDMFPNRGR